ncbi:formate dehydrogenase subunit gamma [Pseudooceanicola sediminis]|uniref:Formate dehydrogenase subunit gamma n=1 Tax=Pseudooceanicola sediminis TaxID=2211117 RepID=A0A399J082_9RHOB|nr:formate dehydrogenase subunit gamma [Pseudooceanicola sediminis]KAA2313873.1 formate dehydrogenase subunit gamma [Puniceibacterium sp. HSS470]RII38691.1 formate dehydrogenase subunit gamma [Pseudooceanicola sediminis]|tara:strand:- start:62229 stop:62696 length:468 start_codon:yes stop_codon:yes gene_type:complete
MHPQPSEEEIRPVVQAHLHLEGPLLPILHDLQARFGFIPEAATRVMAEALNLSVAEVIGVISFYHDFRKAPAGRHVLKLCRAEACQSVGSDALAASLLGKLGVDWHGTTPDGRITVEPVYCLGLCACGPALMLDGVGHGRVDAPGAIAILEEAGV